MNIVTNKKGAAFIIVVISMAVLMIFAIAMTSIATSNYQMGYSERRFQSAFYAAEAGVRHQVEHMRMLFEDLHRRNLGETAFFDELELIGNVRAPRLNLRNQGNDTAFAVIEMPTIPSTGNPRTYVFTSTGNVGGIRRVLRAEVTIRFARMFRPFFDAALFSDGNINIDSNAEIHGNVFSNAISLNSEIARNAKIYGQLNWEQGIYFPAVVSPGGLMERGTIQLRNNDIANVNADGFYSSIFLDNNSVLNFNLSGRDMTIRTGSLSLDNGAAINVTGSGRLFIVIDGNFSIGNNGRINNENRVNNLLMLFAGSGVVNINNVSEINAGVYAPQRSFQVISNNAVIRGSMVVRDVTMRNNSVLSYSYINDAGLGNFIQPSETATTLENMFIVTPWTEVQ